jgi:hypothetical protein
VFLSTRGGLQNYICFESNDLHAFYRLNESFFAPSGDDEYTVRLSYEPDGQLAGYRGYCYLRSGGSK